MKIENLQIGQVLKSYKQLCEVLEESVTAGNSKKSQIKEWERYFNYHKEGNKFIIDEIYDAPLKKTDKRMDGNNKTKYINEIESLILNLLSERQEYDGVVFLSKYLLLKQLSMINENYSFCKRRISKLSTFSKISKENIYEFYDSADNTLVGNLEKALDNLNNKCLVIWTTELTVCETIDASNKIIDTVSYDKYDEEMHTYSKQLNTNHRMATNSESQIILAMENETMEQMGFKNKREIAINNMWSIFSSIMSEKLKDIGIIYYYKSYKIIFNREHIDRELSNNFMLYKSEKDICESSLNKGVVDKLKINSLNRHLKAMDKIEECDNDTDVEKYKRRSKEGYVEDNYKLVNLLVNTDMVDIRQVVKTQKLNN